MNQNKLWEPMQHPNLQTNLKTGMIVSAKRP